LSHATLAILMQVCSPLVAEKIVLSVYVVCFPLAVFYFFDAIRPGKHPLALISFAFIYNYLLFMGFYNFVFSVPLALYTLGFWWKKCEQLSFRRIMVINALCTLLFFCHLMTYAITLGIMLLIALTSRIAANNGLISSGDRVDGTMAAAAHLSAKQTVRRGLGLLSVRSAACLLPTLPLLLLYVHKSTISSGAGNVFAAVQNPSPGHLGQMLNELTGMSILKNYDGVQAVVAQLIGLLLLILLIASIGRRVRQLLQRPSPLFHGVDLFLVTGLSLLVLYLWIPFSSGFYGWLNDRILLIASLLLLGWIDGNEVSSHEASVVSLWRQQFLSSRAVVLIICALVLVNILVVSRKIHDASRVLEEYTASMATIAPHRVVLPLVFGDKTDGLQRSEFLTHASSYFTLGNGGINLDNYEIQFDYFPVTFKPGLAFGAIYDPDWISLVEAEPEKLRLCSYTGYIDYLLVWNEPDQVTSEQIASCYRLISQQGRQKIFIPKSHDKL